MTSSRRNIIAMAILTALCGKAWTANLADCILDRLPGSTNGATNAAVFEACLREHPGGYRVAIKGSGRGLFGFKDGASCTLKKAANTPHQESAADIANACRCLYDKPIFEGATCSSDFEPATARPLN